MNEKNMTMNPREKDFLAKKEISHDPKIITPSSRQWSSTHRNPRIVRVSRAFGGKDRHSKVCTVRGLRDRRIRLSVPTAIQLYDLQDRLGLSQPSKVVDWLIDATKNDIDKLPPLPMLPSNFTHHPNTSLFESNPQSSKEKWIASSDNHQEQENINNQEGFGGFVAQNLFPLGNQSLPYFHWDPPSLSLSQFPFTNQTEVVDQSNSNNNISNSQLYFCPPNVPSIINPSFPASYMSPSMESHEWARQVNNHLQQNPILPTTLHLINSPMKSNVNSKTFHERVEKN